MICCTILTWKKYSGMFWLWLLMWNLLPSRLCGSEQAVLPGLWSGQVCSMWTKICVMCEGAKTPGTLKVCKYPYLFCDSNVLTCIISVE